MQKGDRTSVTFINALKAYDSNSWNYFYDHYAPLIVNFAKKRGCSDDRADDVLQETIIALYRYLPRFKYEQQRGRFRSFLFKITESKIVDLFRKNRRHITMSDPVMAEITPDESEDGRETRMLWDTAWEQNVTREAIEAARLRVRPLTFTCFKRVFLEEESIKSVAKDLEITSNLVSQHKHKVYTLIIEEAKRIKREEIRSLNN
jgi:RNA polymerase sigma-70 factor (ECF subfamily)